LILLVAIPIGAPVDAFMAFDGGEDRRRALPSSSGVKPFTAQERTGKSWHPIVMDRGSETCRTCGLPVWDLGNGWKHERPTK
jgi:hypothetical protein